MTGAQQNKNKAAQYRAASALEAPVHTIFARKTDGTVFECFTWTRDAASGIARAYADAKLHGIEIDLAWADCFDCEHGPCYMNCGAAKNGG